jgi:hypothetical protein
MGKGGNGLKKSLSLLLALFLALPGASAFAKGDRLEVEVNGVELNSDANYKKGNHVYVDVDEFFELFSEDYKVNKNKTKVNYDGKSISVHKRKGELVGDLLDLAGLIEAEKVTYFKGDNLYYVLALPEGVGKLNSSEWANPYDLPKGPIYGVKNNKLAYVEFHLTTPQKYVDGMKGYPSPKIKRVDVEYKQNGHTGYWKKHYDVIQYFNGYDKYDRYHKHDKYDNYDKYNKKHDSKYDRDHKMKPIRE